MKRPASRRVDPVQSRCKTIKAAVKGAEGCSDSVKDMLCSTLTVTVGALKADRHALNERFVAMIGEVLAAEKARLTKDVADKEAAFAELSPSRATRENAVEAAKADAAAKGDVANAAKQAVAEIAAKVKEASAALKEAEKAQKTGDADLVVVEGKKASLEDTLKDCVGPIVDGSVPAEEKTKKAKAVLEMGKTYDFDSSLLTTAEPVLTKEMAERGAFDATCLEQLQAAFAGAIAAQDALLAEGC